MARADAGGGRAGFALPIALAAAAVIGLIALNLAPAGFDIDRSAIGFDGLVAWLSESRVEAWTFKGGDWLTRERVGLRVYPLFEPGPGRANEPDQRSVAPAVVRAKLAAAPTLVVLPKWQAGVIERGVVHPELLIPPSELAVLLAAVAPEAGTLLLRGVGFGRLVAAGNEVALYSAQLVKAGLCKPLIGTAEAMLLGRCDGKATYWLLADPDLIDNHGLTQGDNARATAEILRRLAGTGPVVVDLTTTTFFDQAPPKPGHRREWSDLLRYFQPPFTLAWAALAVLGCLVLWRASIRTGPIAAADHGGWRAAHTVSIDARARLLRLSRHDARLVRVYASDRLQSLAEELFGRHRTDGDAVAAISRLLQPTPALSASFQHAFAREADDAAGEAELLRRVDELVMIRERILDEFGRAAKPRGAHPSRDRPGGAWPG